MNTAVLGRLSPRHRPRAEAHAGAAAYRSTEAVAAEQALASTPASLPAIRSSTNRHASKVAIFRTALVTGSVAAAVVAWLVASGSSWAAEPELAMLLRGMAAMKGLMALSVTGVVWWRLGQPVSPRVAATYIGCAAVLVASTALIWQLAFIPAAAVLFHVAGLVLLVLALREGRQMSRFEWQAPNPSHVKR